MFRFIILLVVGSMLFLSSCMKDDLSSSDLNTISSGISSLAVFNAIPGSVGARLTLNGERFNKTDEVLSFGSSIEYRNVYAGERNLVVENILPTNVTEQANQKLSLVPETAYSLFLYEDNGVKTLLAKDNIIRPREGYAKIRIVHLVKDATALSVWNSLNSQELFKSVSFKGVTDFVEVKAGQSLKLKIRPVDGRTDIPQIDIEEGEIKNKAFYTLLIKGLVETTDINKEVGISLIRF